MSIMVHRTLLVRHIPIIFTLCNSPAYIGERILLFYMYTNIFIYDLNKKNLSMESTVRCHS